MEFEPSRSSLHIHSLMLAGFTENQAQVQRFGIYMAWLRELRKGYMSSLTRPESFSLMPRMALKRL